MTVSSADNLIAVGKISSTHGIRGQLRLHSYSGNLETLQARPAALLRCKDGSLEQVRISRAVRHGTVFLLTLAGPASIEAVERFVGAELLLQRENLPQTTEDEFYWHDLIGLQVLTEDGEHLGILHDILETGANDVYLVQNQQTGREYLLPAISQVIRQIDLQNRIMRIRPLEGLLDL